MHTRLTLPHEELILEDEPQAITGMVTQAITGSSGRDHNGDAVPSGFFECKDVQGEYATLNALQIVAIRPATETFLKQWHAQRDAERERSGVHV